ncbi:hypothetical protein [Paucibacter sp. KBW04]|uniref:hypothetical protein n=1 Tax=Paucibacter sp. KBW04 TaxID=2153361 RepID=UPI000F570EB9|nr:hypothetical protein [Paucibacter sp. KBW04]
MRARTMMKMGEAMVNARQIGRWSKLFGKWLSFEEEVASAREIASKWKLGLEGKQLDAVIEPIAGYASPAWGSDSQWLYLRRPEGVWKTRLPQTVEGDWVMLCQKDANQGVLGALSFKTDFLGDGGWHWKDEGPLSAREIDDLHMPIIGCPDDATEIWEPLWEVVEIANGRTLLSAGEAFGDEELSFSRSGDWLLAMDASKARNVAFDTSKSKAAKRGLEDGTLWLRLQGEWMQSRDIQVNLTKSAI